MNTRFAGALLIVITVGMGTAIGQQKGQYVLGTNGLNAGIQPGPGFSYGNQGTVYWANRLKGPDGQAIPVAGSYDLDIDQNLFIYTSKVKILGGNYGAMFDLIIANADLTAPVIGATAGGVGITDTYIQPFTLGYHFPRIDFTVAYGFIAPTGRYNNFNSAANIGSGYWGNDISSGSTIYLTKNKGTALSVYSFYEFHGKKRYTNITPGQTVSVEWGLSQALPAGKNFLQIGAVGYGQWQTTSDTGSVPDIVKNSRYHVLALGPQATFIVPKWNLNLFFRYEPEFNASARVEGTTLTFGGAISFPVAK